MADKLTSSDIADLICLCLLVAFYAGMIFGFLLCRLFAL